MNDRKDMIQIWFNIVGLGSFLLNWHCFCFGFLSGWQTILLYYSGMRVKLTEFQVSIKHPRDERHAGV